MNRATFEAKNEKAAKEATMRKVPKGSDKFLSPTRDALEDY